MSIGPKKMRDRRLKQAKEYAKAILSEIEQVEGGQFMRLYQLGRWTAETLVPLLNQAEAFHIQAEALERGEEETP